MPQRAITVKRLDPSQAKQPHYRWYIAEKHSSGECLDPLVCRQFVTKKDALVVARGVRIRVAI